MKTVELNVAYEWICDECGRNNFCSAIVADIPQEEAFEIAKKMGEVEPYEELDPDIMHQFQTCPETVTCSHCGEQFSTGG